MIPSASEFGRIARVVIVGFALAGCSVHYTDLSASQQTLRTINWPAPKFGRWLCLTATPGTPIYGGASEGNAVVGYTKNVVAFAGQQGGHWISIIRYDSEAIGYIDGLTIRPFQPAFPGQRCIVYEDVYHRRPLFEID